MKLSSALSTVILTAQTIHATSSGLRGERLNILPDDVASLDRELQVTSCFAGTDMSLMLRNPCNYGTVVESLTTKIFNHNMDPTTGNCDNLAAEEILMLLNVADEAAAQVKVDALCAAAINAYDTAHSAQWTEITGDLEADKLYYNGQGPWNEFHQSDYQHPPVVPGEPSNVLNRDAEAVDDFFETKSQRVKLQWPGDAGITNFEGCEMNAAMCCFVADRQANDRNGNCATPYDTRCTDADPGDNTDLCAVDVARSGTANSADDGIAIYPFNTEGPVHCHGLAWGQDDLDPTTRFRANNLFFVSMSDHMHDRGYVRNVPGAPMCSCLEKSPIVSRADCTEINLKEFYNFNFPATGEPTAAIDYLDINFNSCRARRSNDLYEFFKRLRDEGRQSLENWYKFTQVVVGNGRCTTAMEDLLWDKEYRFQAPPVEGFTQVYGKGILSTTETQPELWETAPTTKDATTDSYMILYRYCPSCSRSSHRHIYYKRITPWQEIDIRNLFLKNWASNPPGLGENKRNVDFKMYSSLEDALTDTNPWTYCNYDHWGIGFPRDCGPTGRVNSEWNSLHYNHGESDYGFYVYTGSG